jgi:hypothetical protein
VAKKWYSYFVVTDDASGQTEGAQPPGTEAPKADGATPATPRRVTDIVPDAEADARFAAPVTGPTDLGMVYTSAQIPVPAHGYTVLKVAEMLRSEHLHSLPQEGKRKSNRVARTVFKFSKARPTLFRRQIMRISWRHTSAS